MRLVFFRCSIRSCFALAGSIVTLSFWPLPRRTRISILSKSTSFTRRVKHSSNRRPAPYNRTATSQGTPFIIVPQSIAGLLTGIVLSFAHTLGEFGVVLMVGGNIEGETRTVSIDIYDEVQALNYAGAAKTALFLLAISYGVLLAVYAMNRKVWALWPQK